MQEQQKTNPAFWERRIGDDFNRASDFDTWYLNYWKVVEAA